MFKVKDEPQLDAGAGNGDVDVVGHGTSDGVVQARVEVFVKDAPDFVPRCATSPSCFLFRLALRAYREVDQRCGNSTLRSDTDSDGCAVKPAPIDEVLLLRSLPFDVNQQLRPDGGARRRSFRSS